MPNSWSTRNANSCSSGPILLSKRTRASSGSSSRRLHPEKRAERTWKTRSSIVAKHAITSSDRKSNCRLCSDSSAIKFASNGCWPGISTKGGRKPSMNRLLPRLDSSIEMARLCTKGTASTISWIPRTVLASSCAPSGRRLHGELTSDSWVTLPSVAMSVMQSACSKDGVKTADSVTSRRTADSTQPSSSQAKVVDSASPSLRSSRRRRGKKRPLGKATPRFSRWNTRSRVKASSPPQARKSRVHKLSIDFSAQCVLK